MQLGGGYLEHWECELQKSKSQNNLNCYESIKYLNV
jgi:hypothetical protein